MKIGDELVFNSLMVKWKIVNKKKNPYNHFEYIYFYKVYRRFGIFWKCFSKNYVMYYIHKETWDYHKSKLKFCKNYFPSSCAVSKYNGTCNKRCKRYKK